MNELPLERKIRRALQQSDERLPDEVRQRLDDTYASLPERRARRWRKPFAYVTASAAIVLLATVVIGFVSPTMAQVLSRIPFVGSVFEAAGDAGLQISSREGLATVVNQTAIDQGIEITMNEVIYDGIRLSVGFVHDRSLGLQFTPRLGSLEIDGNPLIYSMGGVTKALPSNRKATVFKFTPSEPLPEQFTMTLQLDAVELTEGGERIVVDGNWRFETEVNRLREGIIARVFDDPPEKTDGQVIVRVREVMFTPITTMVSFDWIEPWEEPALDMGMPPPPDAESPLPSVPTLEPGALTAPPPPPGTPEEFSEPEWKTEERVSYELIDERGLQLEPFSFEGRGQVEDGRMIHRYTALFAPTDADAQFLVFRPVKERIELKRTGPGSYKNAEEPRHHEASLPTKWPLVLSQGDAGSLTIHEIVFADDQTVVEYEVHGKNPYVQDGAFWLEDSAGNSFRFDRYDQERTSLDRYAYRAVLPPIAEREGLVIKTVELNAPEPMADLEFRLPLIP